MRDTYNDRELCIFLVQMLKIVCISFINSEMVRKLYSVGFLFQICNRNSNTSLLLYDCEVIHLVNKGVISPYLKFNILLLYCVTHCAWNECQPFQSNPDVIKEALFAQYGKIIKTLKNCFMWCSHTLQYLQYFLKPEKYTEKLHWKILMNFGTKRSSNWRLQWKISKKLLSLPISCISHLKTGWSLS